MACSLTDLQTVFQSYEIAEMLVVKGCESRNQTSLLLIRPMLNPLGFPGKERIPIHLPIVYWLTLLLLYVG